MTPQQLHDKYKIFNTDQLRVMADTHRKAADNSQREAALILREIKRRNKNEA